MGSETPPKTISETFTKIPNEVLDWLLPDLSAAELRVLLYVYRRTLGFHKLSDKISLKQICNGIETRAGKPLDRGTGLSREAAIQAIRRLGRFGVIAVHQKGPGRGKVSEYSAPLSPEVIGRIQQCQLGERVNVLDRFRMKRKGQVGTLEKVSAIDVLSHQKVQAIDPQKKDVGKKGEQEKEGKKRVGPNHFLRPNPEERSRSTSALGREKLCRSPRVLSPEGLTSDCPAMDKLIAEVEFLMGTLSSRQKLKLRCRLRRYPEDDIRTALSNLSTETYWRENPDPVGVLLSQIVNQFFAPCSRLSLLAQRCSVWAVCARDRATKPQSLATIQPAPAPPRPFGITLLFQSAPVCGVRF
jgi:hypothetical protein